MQIHSVDAAVKPRTCVANAEFESRAYFADAASARASSSRWREAGPLNHQDDTVGSDQ